MTENIYFETVFKIPLNSKQTYFNAKFRIKNGNLEALLRASDNSVSYARKVSLVNVQDSSNLCASIKTDFEDNFDKMQIQIVGNSMQIQFSFLVNSTAYQLQLVRMQDKAGEPISNIRKENAINNAVKNDNSSIEKNEMQPEQAVDNEVFTSHVQQRAVSNSKAEYIRNDELLSNNICNQLQSLISSELHDFQSDVNRILKSSEQSNQKILKQIIRDELGPLNTRVRQ
jgi:hypothetical protein